jgi:hypothetical protein
MTPSTGSAHGPTHRILASGLNEQLPAFVVTPRVDVVSRVERPTLPPDARSGTGTIGS